MSAFNGEIGPSGSLSLKVVRGPRPGVRGFLTHALPRPGVGREANVWRLKNLPRVLWQFAYVSFIILLARTFGVAAMYGRLSMTKTRADGTVVELGIAGYRVVTTAGVTKIVSFLNASDTATGSTFKFHGFGTGTTAEAVGDTTLVTEFTTEYAVNSTRPTGSQTTNGATVYRTVATFTPDSGGTLAVTEHGVFSASSAGTLLDRTKFSAVNLDTTVGDSIVATYDFTVAAGS